MLKKNNMFTYYFLHGVRDMSKNRPFTVLVEGNIGSGKTTFMNHFQKFRNVALFLEPVNKWRDVQGHNLLGKMYNDPKKWAMTLQSYIQLTMVDLHKQQCPEPIKLMERSLYSARYCFVENFYQNGYLDGPEYVVIDEWFKWLSSSPDLRVDMIVYLRTRPEVALERIRSRGRVEEKEVPLTYLEQLHHLHDKWLRQERGSIFVHEIDGNQNLSEMEEEVDKILPLILENSCKVLQMSK